MFTREEVLEKAKNNQVKLLRLQFTDIFGVLKNITVPLQDLDRALGGRLYLNSPVDGVLHSQEQDIILLPDLSTFAVLPWRPWEGAMADLICDMTNPDGRPYPGCPRNVLKQAVDEVAQLGLEILVSADVQFYLFETDNNGKLPVSTNDQAGFSDLKPADLGENIRRDMILTLNEIGLDIGPSYHESGPGQHIISLKPDNPLAIADKLITFKFILRAIAQRYGLYASLMPKPLNGLPGSAMNLNFALYHREDDYLFGYDEDQPLQLEQETGHFISGVLAHTRANAAITNPLINSYKRLGPGEPAPRYIAWSEDSRDSVLRVVNHRGKLARVEIRNPDPACNPYLALAVILKAGLEGILKQLPLPPPLVGNTLQIKDYSKIVRVDCLPGTLAEALQEIAADQLARTTLGEYMYRVFARAKSEEWARYQGYVHPWELNEYLSVF